MSEPTSYPQAVYNWRQDKAVKTEPLRHQMEGYLQVRNKTSFCIFDEPGLGKTKLALDVACHKFLRKEIEAVLVIAPNSVYKNWLNREAPIHCAVPFLPFIYKSSSEKAKAKGELINNPAFCRGLFRITAMSFDSIALTEDGYNFAVEYVDKFKTFVIVDESTAIAHAGTKRSKRIKHIGKRAKIRWAMSGTPLAEGPNHVHNQIAFVDPSYWDQYGLKSKEAFKVFFGQYEKYYVGGYQKERLKNYQNLEVLQRMIKDISIRRLKDECLDLPPKIYSVRTFELTKHQREVYNSLRDDYIARLNSGEVVEAPLAIVRLARFQQINSGFVTAEDYIDDGENFVEADDDDDFDRYGMDDGYVGPAQMTMLSEEDIMARLEAPATKRRIQDLVEPDKNPRLRLLREIIDERPWKIIVWCRFTRDVELIKETLGDIALTYHGKTKKRDREAVIDQFNDPNSQYKVLVANTAAISQGVTLVIAKTMVYYSNSFSMERRLQSEDRNHRIGQTVSTEIIDLIAEDTVDEYIIDSMVKKKSISDQILGDRFREWVTR